MLATAVTTGAASASSRSRDDIRPQNQAPTHAPSASSKNLIDHGGPILSASHTYEIWWGNPNGWPADTAAGITDFLTGLGSSRYLQTAKEYMRGAAVTSMFGRGFNDSSAPPATDPAVSTIGDEVGRVLSANQLQPDPAAIYLVYTANYPPNLRYCAWHTFVTIRGVTVAIAYMPNLTNIPRCSVSGRNSYSQGTQSLANITAHEVLEAITDPLLNAWFDQYGQENADKCVWTFSGTVPVGSTRWRIQKEWSNALGHCVQLGRRPPRS